MINVTKTYLPKKSVYKQYVDKIYTSGWVTNDGALVRELEARLADYLGVENIVLVASGTAGLEIAYRTLELSNYVLTSPFSFVATTSSLVANGLSPVFVDIDPQQLTIDPKKVEGSITAHTEAIVPVHVFGNVSPVEEIERIAHKYALKVVYDAAHTFGVNYKGQSVLNYGDISVLSFHATKLFHTIEGGALILNDPSLVQKARYLINFGIDGPGSVKALGTNAKMNEFEAAMGLCVLDEIDLILEQRQVIFEKYGSLLGDILDFQEKKEGGSSNYGYFPVIFESEDALLRTCARLEAKNIFARRYFYPSLDSLCYIEPKQNCPVSRDISKRVLCLPIYPGLSDVEQMEIIETIKRSVSSTQG